MKVLKAAALAAILVAPAGCADLTIGNENEASREQVGGSAADTENLIGSSYNAYWFAVTHRNGVAFMLSAASFQNSSTAANFGQVDRSSLPRTAVNNHPADQFKTQYEGTWDGLYRAIAAANDGLHALGDSVIIGTPAANRTPRARAFARFVQGMSHGALGLLYDQAFVIPETFRYDPAKSPREQGLELAPHPDVMAAAMAYLDSAIAISTTNQFTLPSNWMGLGTVSSTDLARLAHFYKARFRALAARTRTERAAVNWQQVLTDLQASGTTEFHITLDSGLGWWRDDMFIASSRGPWGKVPSMIHGMADTSGAFQAWMAKPISDRAELLISTPDKRFPQGSTGAAQGAAPGRYIAYFPGGQSSPDRGTWRFSFYVDRRPSTTHTAQKGIYPEVTNTEKRLLAAEAHFWLGNLAQSAALINETRVGNGGLPPVSASYSPTPPNCVPRLPNGQCGGLFEALKWEWRMESYYVGFGTWYFNSRGWNDLPEGSFLHLPVPARDLQNFGLPVYTTGGSNPGSAARGTYGY
jgi:hypothetical protein